MAEKERIIIDLDFDVTDFTKAAAQLNGEIARLNKEQRELKKQGKEGSIEFQRNSEALRENKKELADTNRAIQNLTTANKANAGSNEQLKAQLSLLTAEYNKLSKEERISTERGKQLQAQTKQISDELKGNEEAVGNNTRSVGDYGKALQGTPFGAFISGIKSMGAAFLANPIGVVILAIVAAFAALRKAFASTEEGQNKLSKVMGVFGTLISKIFDALEPLASFLFDTVVAAFEALGKAADWAMGIVAGGLDLLGFHDAAQGVRNYANELEAAAEGAAKVADARAKAEILERDLIVQRGKIEAQIADAKQKANDKENATLDERKAAIEEAKKGIIELAEKEEERAKLLLEAIKLENSLTNSNIEAKKAEAEAEAALFAIQRKKATDLKALQRDELRVLNEIKKAEQDRIKAYQDAQKKAIDLNKQQLELLIAQQGINKKTLEEEVKLAETVSEEKKKILKKELDAKLINQTQYQIQLIAIENELLQKQTELAIENAKRELDIIKEANEAKIENGTFLNDTLYQQEIERQNNILDAQKEFEAKRLEQGVISQQEYNDALIEIDKQANEKRAELDKAKKEAEAETRAFEMELMLEQELMEAESEFERRQIELDRQKEQELAQAEAIGADKALIESKYAKFSEDLTKQKEAAQLQEVSNTFAAMGSLLQDHAEASKAMAVANAIMNSYQGITAVLAAVSTIPEPFGSIAKGIQAAAIGVQGFRNVNKIISTPVPKAAKGGIFGGQPHSSGGTKGYFSDGTQVEVEKDELFAVVNKKNTGLLGQLSALNSYGGNGVPFFAKGGVQSFADGGVSLASLSQNIDREQNQSNNIINFIREMPNPVVAVQDINEVQSDTNRVQTRASI